MAIVKDWITEAALEIVLQMLDREHQTGALPNGLVAWVEGRILDHCPWKPDTAYMEVPRCDGCRLWSRREADADETGLCGLRERPEGKLWPEGYDGLVTAKDFGCVQWEAKP